MPIKEESFRIGCGRYRQKAGVLSECAGEILRFGNKAFVLGGPVSLPLCENTLRKSFEEGGVEAHFSVHTGTCHHEAAQKFAEEAKRKNCAVVVGVGGGVMMDLAKLTASYASLPVIDLPTSSATCAAFTPLSVCYTPEGATVGSTHFQNEVSAVLADEAILARQPVRLFLAGVFDSLAKFPEIRHRYSETDSSYPLGLDYAYSLARRSFDFLTQNTALCCRDLKKGEVTELLQKAFFATLAVPGIVSGVARGSNQTALGHKFYETARTLYPAETRPYLHGEMVGVGLLLQNRFNGEEENNVPLRSWMEEFQMPQSVEEIGVPATDASRAAFLEKLLSTSAMKECGPGAREKLEESLAYLWSQKGKRQ